MSEVLDCATTCWTVLGALSFAVWVTSLVQGLKAVFFWEVFAVTAVIFTAIVFILISGECADERNWNLEYISTQLAHCSASNTSWSWMFINVLQIQVMLLLYAWHDAAKQLPANASLVLSTATSAVVSMACVVQFHSHGPRTSVRWNVSENDLHLSAAGTAMVAFGVLHFVLWMNLRDPQFRLVTNYSVDLLYLFGIALFCTLALLFLFFGSLPSSDKDWFRPATLEWFALLCAAGVHCLAVVRYTVLMPKTQLVLLPRLRRSWRIWGWWVLSLAFSCSVFALAPMSTGVPVQYVHTSPWFLGVVVSMYAYTALIIAH